MILRRRCILTQMRAFLVAFALVHSASVRASEPVPFKPRHGTPLAGVSNVCKLEGVEVPKDAVVYAAGAYSGTSLDAPIDESGEDAGQIDVVVNSPKPVLLLLGAYEPTVFNVGWTKGTRIVGVVASGYHRAAVAGLPAATPVLLSSQEPSGPCPYFYPTDPDDEETDEDHRQTIRELAKTLFKRKVGGTFIATNGSVVVGKPVARGQAVETSPDPQVASFIIKDAPPSGAKGIAAALREGTLRKAGAKDFEQLREALRAADERTGPVKTLQREGAWVVVKPMTYPRGLYGAHRSAFIIPKGVEAPKGNPGHSIVYDLNLIEPVEREE